MQPASDNTALPSPGEFLPNYLTPNGVERIQREIVWLQHTERPRIVAEVSWAAALGDRSENAEYIYGKKRLRQIDGRLRHLVKKLSRLTVIDPASQGGNKITFGATVVLEDEHGVEKNYSIYGEHEVDVEAGIVSWRSPIARALMGLEEGDEALVKTPKGDRSYEVISVRYGPQEPLGENPWLEPSS